MGTGYTSKIKDGISFEDFALDCSKEFGYLISLRDTPNADVPDVIKPGSYHREGMKQSKEEYEILLNMTDDVKKVDYIKYCKRTMDGWEEIRNSKIISKDSYNNMLVKVKNWQPPTNDHNGLKEFMISQIVGSIDFDCKNIDRPMEEMLTIDEWYDMMLEGVKDDIEYYTKKWKKEVESCEKATKWIQELKRSL